MHLSSPFSSSLVITRHHGPHRPAKSASNDGHTTQPHTPPHRGCCCDCDPASGRPTPALLMRAALGVSSPAPLQRPGPSSTVWGGPICALLVQSFPLRRVAALLVEQGAMCITRPSISPIFRQAISVTESGSSKYKARKCPWGHPQCRGGQCSDARKIEPPAAIKHQVEGSALSQHLDWRKRKT